jgi:AcrR family transcriptional regulator
VPLGPTSAEHAPTNEQTQIQARGCDSATTAPDRADVVAGRGLEEAVRHGSATRGQIADPAVDENVDGLEIRRGPCEETPKRFRVCLLCIGMQHVSEELPKRLTRAEQQAETRRRVLAAADRVFTERGFHAARLEEIAAHAGYTRGAVYSNFKNKDELALAIIEERIATSKALLEELAGAQEPDVGGAQAVGHAFSSLFFEQLPWTPLFLEFVTHASRHPELAQKLRALYRDLADAISEALEAASSQAGIALPAASQRLALLMLAATNGSAVERMIDPERADGTLAGEMLGWMAGGLLASNRN